MSAAEKLAQMKAEKSAANLLAGEKFLEENKKRPGVVELEPGLQYEILTEGHGPKPSVSNSVTCHYHGTLTDGTVFDSSVLRGTPATFPLNGVIKCWTEGVQLMKVGGKSRLVCPSDLAYGDNGAPPRIKPGSTLVFEVEL